MMIFIRGAKLLVNHEITKLFSEKVKKLKIRKNRGILNHYFWVLQK